jgi:hypothetical protein
MEIVAETVNPLPKSAKNGPRSEMARRVVGVMVGGSAVFASADRTRLAASVAYWARLLGRSYATRVDPRNKARIRLYRLR